MPAALVQVKEKGYEEKLRLMAWKGGKIWYCLFQEEMKGMCGRIN